MTRRSYERDTHGRFASAGVKVTARAVKAHRPRYVHGSFEKHLEVGRVGDYKGVKIGAEFRTPAGRGVLVKGIAGYHGKPDRRLDVTPKLDKAKRKLTFTARPNPARAASAGSKVGKKPMNTARTTSAGRRVR